MKGTDRAQGQPRYLNRFMGRAGDYSRYRPSYPSGIIPYLEDKIGFNRRWVVADIGSGTGILSGLFLKNGNRVFCVEPNRDMRQVAEKNLERYLPLFISINGSAEKTNLEAGSADLIVVGQAFHWFDLRKARLEFRRILRKNGSVAIIYNHRRMGGGVEEAYGRIVARHGKNWAPVPNADEAYVSRFFGVRRCEKSVLPNSQTLDLNGVLGRLASASYMPARGSQRWAAIEIDVGKLMQKYGRNGTVRLRYDTVVYLGRFAGR